MKKIVLTLLCVGYCVGTQAQKTTPPTPTSAPAKEEKAIVTSIPFNPDANVVTEHTTTIKGQKVPFLATTVAAFGSRATARLIDSLVAV